MLSKTFATGSGDFYPQTEMQSDATLFRIIQWSPFQLKCFWLGKLDATWYFKVLNKVLTSAAAGPPAVSGAGGNLAGRSGGVFHPSGPPRYATGGAVGPTNQGRAWEYFTLETSVSYQNWRKQIIRLTQCCQQPKQKGENYFSNYFNIFQRYNRECSICCQKSVSICISASAAKGLHVEFISLK